MWRPGRVWCLWVVAVFAVINGTGWWLLLRQHEGLGGSVVPGLLQLSFAPASSLMAEERVAVVFSEPMVDEAQIGKRVEPGAIRLVPVAVGGFVWEDASTAVLALDEPLAPARDYTITVDTSIVSLAGARLARPVEHPFICKPLTFISFTQRALLADLQADLVLSFNQKVHPELLRQHATLKAPDGSEIAFELLQDEPAQRLTMRTTANASNRLHLIIDPRLTGSEGPRPLGEQVEAQLELVSTLRIESVWATVNDNVAISIRANQNFREDLPAWLSIEPAVAVTAVDQGWRTELRGNFEHGKRYTITFKAGLSGRAGDALVQEVRRSVQIPDRQPIIDFAASGSVLTASGRGIIGIESVNVEKVDVELRRIFANNVVHAMRDQRREWYQHSNSLSREAGRLQLDVAGAPNTKVLTRLNLREMVGEQTRGLFLMTMRRSGSHWPNRHRLISLTDLGLTIKRGARDGLVWVTDLHNGQPVADATVSLYTASNQLLWKGNTDTDGMMRWGDLSVISEHRGEPFLVIAEKGSDMAALEMPGKQPLLSSESLRGAPYARDGYHAFLFSERGVYRPGETIHLQAIVRNAMQMPPGQFPVEIKLTNPRGRDLATLSAQLDAQGIANAEFAIPALAELGRYGVTVRTPDGEPFGATSFRVAEFLPDRLKVSFVEANPGDLLPGAVLTATAEARYLYGQPAADLEGEATISYASVPFAPKEYTGFDFADDSRPLLSGTVTRLQGKTDDTGRIAFTWDVPHGLAPPSAVDVTIEASIAEVSGRAVSIRRVQRLHPYPHYIGLRARPGTDGKLAREVAVVLLKPDGGLASDQQLQAVIYRVHLSYDVEEQNGRWRYVEKRQETELERQQVVIRNGIDVLSFVPPESGRYRVRVADPASGAAADMDLWHAAVGTQSRGDAHQLALALDREAYAIGDEAIARIDAPFAGEALVTVLTDRVDLARRITLQQGMQEIRLPIAGSFRPNGFFEVKLVRGTADGVPGELMPLHAAGIVPLSIDESANRLHVNFTHPEDVRPGQEARIRILVTDREGRPVQAAVTLAAVDEGICRLTGYRTPDPFGFFYGRRALSVSGQQGFEGVLPELEPGIGIDSVAGGDAASMANRYRNPVIARRVASTSLWRSGIQTDAEGVGEVDLAMPAFNGELRLMAVVVDRQRFGSGQSSMLVRQPVMVHAALPRFMAPGDRITLPVTVTNQTESADPVVLTMGAEKARLQVAPDKLATHWFPMQAPERFGPLTVEVQATLGSEQGTQSIELPIRPPHGWLRRFGSGSMLAGERASIELPGGWFDGTAKAHLALSTGPDLEVLGGLDYLLKYPYGCLEQTTSSAFPLLYLADLARHVDPALAADGQIQEFVEAAIWRIADMQMHHGGLGMWPGSRQTVSWSSIYATHFLVEAGKAGYRVPGSLLQGSLTYLENTLADEKTGPIERTYALYVLTLADRPHRPWLYRLAESAEALPAQYRLMLVRTLMMIDENRRAQQVLALQTSETMHQLDGLAGAMASPTRDRAIHLSMLLDIRPDSPQVTNLVAELLKSRRDGKWRSTQENAFALLALGKFARMRTKYENRFTVEVRQDGELLGTFAHDQLQAVTPVVGGGPVLLSARGIGQLWYHWSVDGVPRQSTFSPEDEGLLVRRRYLTADLEPVDGPMKAGELYIVELSLTTFDGHDDLVIVDLLPAGLEIEDESLETRNQQTARQRQVLAMPMAHVERRDDRMLLFPAHLAAGTHRYRYVVRAVTAGDFVLPPVTADCMYSPEIRSEHGAGRLEVIR